MTKAVRSICGALILSLAAGCATALPPAQQLRFVASSGVRVEAEVRDRNFEPELARARTGKIVDKIFRQFCSGYYPLPCAPQGDYVIRIDVSPTVVNGGISLADPAVLDPRTPLSRLRGAIVVCALEPEWTLQQGCEFGQVY